MVFAHPVKAGILMLGFTIFYMTGEGHQNSIISLLTPIFAGGVLYTWYLVTFPRFERPFNAIAASFLLSNQYSGEVGSNVAARRVGLISGQSFSRVLELFMHIYGPLFLYFGLASAAVVLFAVWWWRDAQRLPAEAIALFGAGGLFAVALLMFDINIESPHRVTNLLTIASIVLIALFLISARQRSLHRTECVIVAVILLTAIGSAGTVHWTSAHLTEANFEGVEWSTAHQSASSEIYSPSVSREMIGYRYGIQMRPDWEIQFGRQPANISSAKYVITTPRDQTEYFRWSRASWARHADINQGTFNKLNRSRDTIYVNGGYTVRNG